VKLAARLVAPPRGAAGALSPPRRAALAPMFGAPRHIMAAIDAEACAMPRPSVIRLEESPAPPPRSATIIDAEFAVVGGKRAKKQRPQRGFFGKIKRALTLAAWAALIGLMIPPTVVAVSLLLRHSG
jgi:hypothetical protein